jgi:ParB-like chromosome segregation protein Spo0J
MPAVKNPAALKAGRRKLAVSRLHPDPQNYKEITPERLDDLARDIERDPEHFDARPIICDEKGTIIGGEQRWRAAVELGWKHVPGYVIVKPTAARRREIMIRDNVPYGTEVEGALADLVAEQWRDDDAEIAHLGLPEADLKPLLELAGAVQPPEPPPARAKGKITRTVPCPNCGHEVQVQGAPADT